MDPHDTPAITLLVPSTQTGAPVAHEMTPFLHADGLPLHPAPAVHETQLPELLQTMLVPQLVPAALFVSSTHVCTPVEESSRFGNLLGEPSRFIHRRYMHSGYI